MLPGSIPSSPALSPYSESDVSTLPTTHEPSGTPGFCPSVAVAAYSRLMAVRCPEGTGWLVNCCPLSENTPVIPNLEQYMVFTRDTVHDAFDCGPGCRQCPVEMAHYIASNPLESVMSKAATDAQSILELAARCASGCAAPFEPEAAILFADIVAQAPRSLPTGGTPLRN
ncbi:hypothetical protein L227DRAFT_236150 [Lentinus tigrinus ALCF2SS1-6]|uniref:Uncharacterized protein n=1 Tax=Lentinus tigrinus ALCF2SS1-6 TaxID=1328759 RepID=A0A5C2S1D5_9APHY|nr:hypothetical protein L227DRAFT_236150 [Lentinus tigrinus ALCF2SS1-6]